MRAWPNTYAYTKCLAEELVQDLGAGLPITIFRPAMGKHIVIVQFVDFNGIFYLSCGNLQGSNSGMDR